MESVLAFFGERGSELLANKEGRLKARILAHFVLKHKPASHLAKTFLQMATHTQIQVMTTANPSIWIYAILELQNLVQFLGLALPCHQPPINSPRMALKSLFFF